MSDNQITLELTKIEAQAVAVALALATEIHPWWRDAASDVAYRLDVTRTKAGW